MQSDSIQTLVLVNPNARKGKMGEEWPQWESQVLEALGERKVQVVFTTKGEHGTHIVRKALLEGVKKVVVVGGDGTLSEALRGFYDDQSHRISDAVILPLPGGRGDDFFKSLSHKRWNQVRPTLEDGIHLIKTGTPSQIDIGEMQWMESPQKNQIRFINSVGFGFAGLLVDKVQKNAGILGKIMAKGSWTYRLQGILALMEYRSLAVRVKVDGKSFFEGKIFFGIILNGRYSGGGVCWEPDGKLDDGLFNIFILQPFDTQTLVKCLPDILRNNWDHVPGVLRTSGKHVEVRLLESESKPHPLFEVDGDILEAKETRGAEFQIAPKEVRVQSL